LGNSQLTKKKIEKGWANEAINEKKPSTVYYFKSSTGTNEINKKININ